MTIETIEPTQPPTLSTVGAASIEATARALVDAHKIGTALCRTAFVPKHFQGKPDDAAAAILYGSTINMDPVTALQNVYVIGGKPALYARTMAAIVMSHGHEMWTEEESDGTVTVAGRRKGSDNVERVTWTADMAQRAGYTTNANYKTNPRAMLYARASGDVARRIAPDALLGMAHNVEELTVSEPAPRPVASKPADRMRAALRPEVTVEQVQPDPEPETGEALTDKTRAHMFALFSERGITERDEQIAGIARVIGREIESRSELTEVEGQAVVASLRGAA